MSVKTIMDIGKGPPDGQSYDDWMAESRARPEDDSAARWKHWYDIMRPPVFTEDELSRPATKADIQRLHELLTILTDRAE